MIDNDHHPSANARETSFSHPHTSEGFQQDKISEECIDHLQQARACDYDTLLHLLATEVTPIETVDDRRWADIPRMDDSDLIRQKYSRITPAVEATMGFYARDEEDVLSIFEVAQRRKENGAEISVTTSASGFSFGEHALPPAAGGTEHRWMISTKHFHKGIELYPQTPEQHAQSIFRISTSAGLTFRELHDALDDQEWRYLPFNVPTADGISLGGALAANTLSRSSSIDGFFLDHVHAFTLVTPTGVIRCAPDAPDLTAKALFFAFPGSQGMLGCVTDIEFDVKRVPKRHAVHTQVLTATGNPKKFVEQFLTHARDNVQRSRNGDPHTWNKGVYATIGGHPAGAGRGYVYGSREATAEHRLPSFPMYGDHPLLNSWAQIFSHLNPRLTQETMRWVFPQGKSFEDPLYTYTYFQNSHQEARSHPGILGCVLDTTLPVTQQTWVMSPENLEDFMREVRTMLRKHPFRPIANWIELQDLVFLPQSSALLSPCHNDTESIAYTVSCAADTGGSRSALVQEFFGRLSTQAFTKWGVKVHLLKEAYCPNELLRETYGPALQQAEELREHVDPHHIIRSGLSDRLLGEE